MDQTTGGYAGYYPQTTDQDGMTAEEYAAQLQAQAQGYYWTADQTGQSYVHPNHLEPQQQQQLYGYQSSWQQQPSYQGYQQMGTYDYGQQSQQPQLQSQAMANQPSYSCYDPTIPMTPGMSNTGVASGLYTEQSAMADPSMYYSQQQVQSHYTLPRQQQQVMPSGPSTPSRSGPSASSGTTRSPRYNGSINGPRLNAFVFPQQSTGYPSRSSVSSSSSHPQQAGNYRGPNLPAKPTFGSSSVNHTTQRTTHDHTPGRKPALSSQQKREPEVALGRQLLDKMPPLPPLAQMPETPPSMAELDLVKSGKEEGEDKDETSRVDAEARLYLSSLLQVVASYKAREEALQYRIQALALSPKEVWPIIEKEAKDLGVDDEEFTRSLRGQINGESKEQGTERASVLGVRLLRKYITLQKENDELGRLLTRQLDLNDEAERKKTPGQPQVDTSAKAEEDKSALQNLEAELSDAQELIASMSAALKKAEARATSAERALQVVVDAKSQPL